MASRNVTRSPAEEAHPTRRSETAASTAAGVNQDARRQEIINEAAVLFDHSGYHATNMNDLAQAIGLRKPSLYHYFTSKSEILYGIHEQFIDLLLERQQARAGHGLSPKDELRAVMRDILELMETHRGHIRVFFEHHRELGEREQTTVREKRDTYQHLVDEVIERGIEDGSFRKVDPRLAALAMFGMCNWAYQWYHPGGPLKADEVADFFADLLLRGLAT